VTNYNFLFIIVTILVTNNFLLCKLIFKLVIIVTNKFWSLRLVTNETFSCSVSSSTCWACHQDEHSRSTHYSNQATRQSHDIGRKRRRRRRRNGSGGRFVDTRSMQLMTAFPIPRLPASAAPFIIALRWSLLPLSRHLLQPPHPRCRRPTGSHCAPWFLPQVSLWVSPIT